MIAGSVLGILLSTYAVALGQPHIAPPPGATEVVTEPIVGDPALGTDIEQTYVRIHYRSPYLAGTDVPPECDWLSYLRYRHKDGPQNSADADAVITVQPGTYSGATNLAPQAPQVVRKAAAQGKFVEYIALDRRANCAEDNTGWDAAAREGDYHRAAEYYFQGKEVDGKRYAPPTPQSLSYLGEFGLALAMDDWRAVIEQVLPDPDDRGRSFCGGHSLGAFLVGPMLAWDFDTDPATVDDAGFSFCGGGGIALDGLAITDPAGFAGTGLVDDLLSDTLGGVRDVAGAVTDLLPVAETPIASAGNIMNTYSLVAMAAHQDPNAESDLPQAAPRDLTTEAWMRAFYGADYLDLVVPHSLPDQQRLTNQAALGMLFDQNSSEYVLQAGTGFYDCDVVGKTYPVPNGLTSIPIIGQLLVIPHRVGYGQNYIPADPKTLCGWRNYDQVWPSQVELPGSPNGTPTDVDHEVTDIDQLARAMTPGLVPVDFFERFTPLRLIFDTAFALGGIRNDELAGLQNREGGILEHLLHGKRWQSTPTSVPVLTLLSGDSPVQNVKYGALVPANAIYLPGYRHYDVVTAAEQQNNGLPEPASAAIAAFVTRGR
ncbi:hypothetical protein NY08_2187 [Rhodococcus sp. B7740]|uniref:hypothetical protein n=1 Tax=Rhodococcus sp. B7740 TaxID=1564114 RepID=UPI0005D7DD00|nr:hypothetical protein [Rhodococcus sp. B7740]AJW40215.1 hypothetical protein NY08_2187 [Rhodococcus sp. B7740]